MAITEDHKHNSPNPVLQETVPVYPVYEFEYEINIPLTVPKPKHSQSLLFIDWSRCEQCPHMINYGKDIKIE